MNELQSKEAVFIKNTGFTKTFVEDGAKQRHTHELEWTMDYDGNDANIDVNTNIDGQKQHHATHLTKQDLENMLHIPAIDAPIHQRLERDFSLGLRKPIKKSKKIQNKSKKTKKNRKKILTTDR
jgi:hypothetical protein